MYYQPVILSLKLSDTVSVGHNAALRITQTKDNRTNSFFWLSHDLREEKKQSS